ncbi:MAG: hypothetical protein E7595_03670 [Ruminococcaceae bacterium]|nr:hypothetical protein [Oscillospiraceae bacterium]
MTYDETVKSNNLIFERLAILLNNRPDFITKEMVDELVNGFGLSQIEAYSLLLCAALGFDTEIESDRKLWESYAPHMIHHLDEQHFLNDEYCRAINIEGAKKLNEWELRIDTLAPYTAFVCDDPLTLPDGRVIPQIAFFDSEYKYISVLQNGREWMTMMPNEIVTQRLPIKRANGRICTYGLGLGYFVFMCAQKDSVESVTVVERDESVITLFKEMLLPLFDKKEKIEIVCADAFDFAEKEAPKRRFDYIFADIWHDPSDGVEAYKRFKSLEYLCPDTSFDYWIEKTLKLYM